MYRKFIPQRFKDSAKVLLGRATIVPTQSYLNKVEAPKYFCPVCSSPIREFDRLPDFYYENLDRNGYIFPIFQAETINYLKYTCPSCGASDRDRLYALYLQRSRAELKGNAKLLDIAPSQSLGEFLKKEYPSINYTSADLIMNSVDDCVDITQMEIYADEIFDFFICSHVLEHVQDDRKAMSELFRVLKSGGKGIAMVPIMLSIEEDYEDPAVITPEDRWKHFGQDDHVRVYSKPGFINKLSFTGFLVHQLGIDFFGSDIFDKHGIHPRSVLYIVEKPSNSD